VNPLDACVFNEVARKLNFSDAAASRYLVQRAGLRLL